MSTSCAPTRPARSRPGGSRSSRSRPSGPTRHPRSRSAASRAASPPRTLTSAALAAALPGAPWTIGDEVPFASSLRWSGLVTDPSTGDGAVWVLGAPDALAPHLTVPLPENTISDHTTRGLRVLVLARADPTAGLRDGEGRPSLPSLEPVAVVALADELRPEAAEAVARFRTDGVAVKVLSGDDPRTVAALTNQAGLDAGDPVPGAALDGLDDAGLDRLVARTAVFGRVAPEHKERIVADIVLVDDSFAALLPAQREGRRIINGIAMSMYVFLARVASQGLVIVAVTMLGLGFPYSPTQVGLTLLTVGVPTMFLTFWAPS